jgi:hypothetical protein
MLDLARQTHCRLCWREATGEWSFVPIAESTNSAAAVTNPQADDKPVDDDGEIVL